MREEKWAPKFETMNWDQLRSDLGGLGYDYASAHSQLVHHDNEVERIHPLAQGMLRGHVLGWLLVQYKSDLLNHVATKTHQQYSEGKQSNEDIADLRVKSNLGPIFSPCLTGYCSHGSSVFIFGSLYRVRL
jgi:hypothetical protein